MFQNIFWILRIEVIIYKESRTGAPRKRNLPASMEKERNLKLDFRTMANLKLCRREIFALCEISGLREICDWLLVFFYTIFPFILSRKIQFVFFYSIFCISGAMINHSLYTDQTTPNTLCTILFDQL